MMTKSGHRRNSSIRNNNDKRSGEAFRTSSSSSLHLFFQTPESDASFRRRARQVPPSDVLVELSSDGLTLPFSCRMEGDQSGTKTTTASNDAGPPVLTVRHMEWSDIDDVTDICCLEYGDDASKLAKISLWTFLSDPIGITWYVCDQLSLRPCVDVTMRMKVLLHDQNPLPPSRKNHKQQFPMALLPSSLLSSSSPPPSPSSSVPFPLGGYQDHAVLVACIDGEIAGIIELSRQPVQPERNPPAYPVPRWLKEMQCRLMNETDAAKRGGDPATARLEGWITNLLVSPKHRGKRIGKVLVAAGEGLARSWDLRSVHLHCDADIVNGRVAQQLYQSMGFGKSNDAMRKEYAWMNPSGPPGGASAAAAGAVLSSSIYVIEGVPLLYLRKDLV